MQTSKGPVCRRSLDEFSTSFGVMAYTLSNCFKVLRECESGVVRDQVVPKPP